MKLKRLLALGAFMSLALLYSCSEDEVPFDPTAGLIKITEGIATDADVKVEVWAYEELFVGYNPVFVALYDVTTGNRITNAEVSLMPMMAMSSGMNHSCPVESPVSVEAVNALFPGSITFIMGSSDMGTWTLDVNVFNTNASKEGTVEFDITVATPAVARIKSFTVDNASYFVSYTFAKTPKVGVNDIAVMINKRETMMSFPGATGFTIGMEPEMPSMGHGSPNNVDPTHKENGHYMGKVNFTMTGEWRINLDLVEGELNKELYFDLEIE